MAADPARGLLLIDPSSPSASADAIGDLRDGAHDVLVLGTHADAQRVRRAGLEPINRVGTPLRTPLLAWNGVRRFLRTRPYPWIQTLSIEAAAAAGLAAPHLPRRLVLGIGPPARNASSFALRLAQRGAGVTEVRYGSRAARDAWMEHGLPGGPVVEPTASTPARDPERATSLRSVIGVPDDAFLIGLVTDPPQWGDAHRAAGTAVRLAATGRKIRLCLHPDASRHDEACAFLTRLDADDLLCPYPTTPLACIDALLSLHDPLVTAGDDIASLRPVRAAEAAGLPVVRDGEAAAITDQLVQLIDRRKLDDGTR